MKGIVFTQFLEHVEQGFGPAMVGQVVGACELVSGGVYATEGTYPCGEMGQLIAAFARLSGKDPVPVLQDFGRHLAKTFHQACPEAFRVPCFFDFVESMDSHIHAEVRRQYPDAQLPRFHTVSRGDDVLVIDYVSSLGLEDLAFGLFRGFSEIFGETVHITSAVDRDVPVFAVRFKLAH